MTQPDCAVDIYCIIWVENKLSDSEQRGKKRIMNSEEKVLYIANTAAIASVDGSVDSAEGKAIREVQKGIGAVEAELHKALTMAAEGSYKITPVGRLSDRIRNLEDMFYVALSDGDFSKSEKPEIISFVKSIKLSQEQLNDVLAEVKQRLQPDDAGGLCPSCKKDIPAGSKFCPFCGGKII